MGIGIFVMALASLIIVTYGFLFLWPVLMLGWVCLHWCRQKMKSWAPPNLFENESVKPFQEWLIPHFLWNENGDLLAEKRAKKLRTKNDAKDTDLAFELNPVVSFRADRFKN